MMRTGWSRTAASLFFACRTPVYNTHAHIDPNSFDFTAMGMSSALPLIKSGKLGKIYAYRAVYLQEWGMAHYGVPLIWRYLKAQAGSGALGDLGAHIIDLGRFLVGDIREVSGHLETFIEKRPLQENPNEMGDVTVDDASMFVARFGSGALGTFEASRFAVGRKNHNRFEINGSRGSVIFNLERMTELEYYNAEDPSDKSGFRVIQATDPSHPFTSAWWPPGHIIGYEHTFTHLVADGFEKMARGENPSPDFEDGLRNQAVLDAVERSSASRKWESV